jgi:hypothetical protein
VIGIFMGDPVRQSSLTAAVKGHCASTTFPDERPSGHQDGPFRQRRQDRSDATALQKGVGIGLMLVGGYLISR